MNNKIIAFSFCVFLTLVSGCKTQETVTPATTDPVESNPDWTEASHGGDATPDYTVVFPQEQVNSLEITLTKAQWDSIRTDMKSKFGTDFGGGRSTSGAPPAAGAGGGGLTFGTDDPDYFAVTLKFNNKTWNKVGFRLKGNSSLSSVWGAGIYKLPFRLDFDEFEDKYPAIKNQRLYGFNELSMSPAYSDNSLIREKVVADIFRMAGVPAAQTAFYKVYINFGEGKKYCGVYTMVEVIDDTMVKKQFGEDQGNIYKPESTFASFTQSEFEKKNNKTANDYSDVQATVTALNSTLRTTNPTQWRTNLEKVFNVDHFIKWLAVNSTIVNWDSYGSMAHNYYLYNSPDKKLTWIPWDHNMSMTSASTQSNGGGNAQIPGGGAVGGGMGQSVSISLSEVTNKWPLIRYIGDDAVYYARYKQYISEFVTNVFTSAKMDELFTKNTNLITPYVTGTEKEVSPYTNLTSQSAFTSELASLKAHVITRRQVAADFLK